MLTAAMLSLWLSIAILAYGLDIQMTVARFLYKSSSIQQLVAAIDGRSQWVLPLLRLLQYRGINLYAEYEGPPIDALKAVMQVGDCRWVKHLVDVGHIQKRPELFDMWRSKFYQFNLNFGVETWHPGRFTPKQQVQILKDMSRGRKLYNIRSFSWCSRLSFESSELVSDMFHGSLIFLYPIKSMREIFAQSSEATEAYYQMLLKHDGSEQFVASIRFYLAIARLSGGNTIRKVNNYLQRVLAGHWSELEILTDARPKRSNHRKRLHAFDSITNMLVPQIKSLKSYLRAHIEADLAIYLAKRLKAPEKIANFVISLMKRYPVAQVPDVHLWPLLELVGRKRYLSQQLKDWPKQFANIRYERLVPRSFQSAELSLTTWRKKVTSRRQREPQLKLENRNHQLSNLHAMFEELLLSSNTFVFREAYVFCRNEDYISYPHALADYFSYLLKQAGVIIEDPRRKEIYRFHCTESNLPYVGAIVYAELVRLVAGSVDQLSFDPIALEAVSRYPKHLLLAGRQALCVNSINIRYYRSYLKAVRQVLVRYSYF